MVIGLTANSFMQTLQEGAKDGVAAVPGMSFTYTGPPQPNPTTQIKMFRDALATRPVALAVMPTQATLWNRPLSDATAKGIPTITFNEAPPEGSPVKTYVGIDERTSIVSLLEALKKKIGAQAKGTIVIGTCVPGIATLDFRTKAYKQEIAKRFPGVRVKGPVNTTTEPSKNFSNWQQAMSANRDALAFLGNCDADGPGLIKAKKQTGVQGQILTVDTSEEILAGIKDGTMLAALAEAPYLRGYVTTRLVADAAKSGKPVPEGFVDVTGEIVDASNIDTVAKRESSIAGLRQGYKQFIDDFFKDPAARIKPLTEVYQ